MRPVSPPIGFMGVQPSLKQCFLPEDKKNLLLPSMFNPDPEKMRIKLIPFRRDPALGIYHYQSY